MQAQEWWLKSNSMMVNIFYEWHTNYGLFYGPVIDVIKDLFHAGSTMAVVQALHYPGDKVIFKNSLDYCQRAIFMVSNFNF